VSALLRRLLDPAYLYAQRAGAVEPFGAPSLVLLCGLLVGAVLTWHGRWRWARDSAGRRGWTVAASALLVAGVLYAGRRAIGGPLSARVWYLSALGVAVLASAVALYDAWGRRGPRRAPWLGQTLDAAMLRLEAGAPMLPGGVTLALAAVHLGGMAALIAWHEAGWWLPALAVACLAAAGWRRVEVLTPLFVAYAGWALRAVVGGPLGVATRRYLAFPYPDPWSPWFDTRIGHGAVTLLVGVGGTVLATGAYTVRRLGLAPRARQRLLAAAVLVGAALWFLALVVTHRSAGATGSDPFCYLQMAADLAHTGSARHTYPLATLLWARGLPTWPAVPVGYHPPDAAGGAVTVWPIGWPLLLAGLLRLGGEGLALWGAPLCALGAAGLTYLLAREAAGAAGEREEGPLAGALAAAILLTSQEGALRALVPMADAAAQALAVAAMLALWRAQRTDRLAGSALAGLLLAGAYGVRHPLLPLGLAALPAYLGAPWRRRRRLAHLGVYGVAALAGALPDLAYHRWAFGSPWVPESPEGDLLSWRHIGPSLEAMLHGGWLRRAEFGYLVPFILIGIGWQWRDGQRRALAASCAVGLVGTVLLNLSYSALRLRDLLSVFAWGALWAGWGMVALWRWAASAREGARRRRALVLLAMAMALAARASPVLALPWQEGVWTFGYVTAAQRDAYAALAEALPPDAVVATGLGAGAVARYTGREVVRPDAWTDDELLAFVALLGEQRRPLYVLLDGEEMSDVLARGILAVAPAGTFDLPVMGRGGQWQPGPAVLYAVRP
jgi:hypothetical protein